MQGYSQGSLLGNGATRSRLGQAPSINVKSRQSPTDTPGGGQLDLPNPSLSLSFRIILGCVKLTVEVDRHRTHSTLIMTLACLQTS